MQNHHLLHHQDHHKHSHHHHGHHHLNFTVHPMSSFLAPRSSKNQKRNAWIEISYICRWNSDNDLRFLMILVWVFFILDSKWFKMISEMNNVGDDHLYKSPEDAGKHHHYKEHNDLEKNSFLSVFILIAVVIIRIYLWVFHDLPNICQDLFSRLLEIQSEN